MAIKMNKENAKNIIDVMNEMKQNANINLGIEEIEFPDGTKEKFYYNGEQDKQAAIDFAQICINATSDSCEAKGLMFTCFNLLTKEIYPTEIANLSFGKGYIDHAKGILVDGFGNVISKLTDEEKPYCKSKNKEVKELVSKLLKERAEKAYASEEDYDEEYEDDDDEDIDW